MRTKIISKTIDYLYTIVLALTGFIILFFFIKIFFFSSFRIPSDSMEPTLTAGDFVLVNKLSYGARIFNIQKAIRKEEFKIHRTPGFQKIKRNDVIVFNNPYPQGKDKIGFDVAQYYIKRCIGLPGDTLWIENSEYKIKGVDTALGNVQSQKQLNKKIQNKGLPEQVIYKVYPKDSLISWSLDHFGPLVIPKKNTTIEMSLYTMILYKRLIEWEEKEELSIRGEVILLGGSPITKYKFKENYYFAGGDKTENSEDSRYWGVFPEEFIVGKAFFIWKSVEPATKKLNRKRSFTFIY